MIQVDIESAAGCAARSVTVRRFPAVLGRDPSCEVQVEQPGVWRQHVRLELDPDDGIHVVICQDAVARHNGVVLERARFRQGDVLEFGGATARLWFTPVNRKSVVFREIFLWCVLALLMGLEIVVVACLAQAIHR